MKVWKDKKGKKITAKEFASRFKKGITNITPTQKLQNELRATFITFIGYVMGAVSLIVFIKSFPNSWLAYGLILIFVGSGYSSLVKLLMTRQQLKVFKNLDSTSSSVEDIFKALEKSDKIIPVEEETKEVSNDRRST